MIAYNKDQLDNLHIHEQLDEACDENNISKEEKENCKNKYPVGLYRPNIGRGRCQRQNSKKHWKRPAYTKHPSQ